MHELLSRVLECRSKSNVVYALEMVQQVKVHDFSEFSVRRVTSRLSLTCDAVHLTQFVKLERVKIAKYL